MTPERKWVAPPWVVPPSQEELALLRKLPAIAEQVYPKPEEWREMGRLLNRIRSLVPYGHWTPFLERCGMSTYRAWKWMQRCEEPFVPRVYPRKPRSECKVDGCDNTVEARGMCNKHYCRWKRGKSEKLPPRQKPVCRMRHCERRSHCRGLCEPHYAQHRRGTLDKSKLELT